ncbi:MAG: cysteine synthase A [Pseudomonadota bacterium]
MAYPPVAEGILPLVGQTPLVKLKAVSEATGCTILGKAEWMNPGGSVKDRAAHFIIQDAMEKGELTPGGTVVEGTAGNTGIGLATVGNALGLKTVIVMPETQSQEKIDTLRALGAELILVPPAPYKSPAHFVHTSRRIAEEREGAIWANQFDNTANRMAHIQTTAPEIWEGTHGKVDGFTCACGTGGTLAGVGMGLKERNGNIKIALTDPMGASLYHYFANGELKAEGTSIAEGIGQSRITANLEDAPVDMAFQASDEEGLPIVFDLMQHEGLCLGLSSGINVLGAVKMAREMGPGHTIVTILCDSGMRYLSRIFNPAFLREKGLPTPPWMSN